MMAHRSVRSALASFAQKWGRCEHNEFRSECEEPECVTKTVMDS